jgi:ComF family protein
MEFSQASLTTYWKQKSLLFNDWLRQLKIALGCCDLCGGSCQSQGLICDFCLTDLPFFDLNVLHGNLLLWPAANKLLPKRKFDYLITVAPYQWPINLWVKQLKYQGRFEIVDLLGSLLLQQWQSSQQKMFENNQSMSSPSLLISVPIHLKKFQLRGFNQAHLLAENFACKSHLKYLPNALIRVTNDKSQANQTGVARRKNLRQAFQLSPELLLNKSNQETCLAEHVLLLDDVVTTGSTCNEICRILKRHGVKKITVLSLCLSLPETQLNR